VPQNLGKNSPKKSHSPRVEASSCGEYASSAKQYDIEFFYQNIIFMYGKQSFFTRMQIYELKSAVDEIYDVNSNNRNNWPRQATMTNG